MSQLGETNEVPPSENKENAEKICEFKKVTEENDENKVEIHVFCVVRPSEDKSSKVVICCSLTDKQLVTVDSLNPNTKMVFLTDQFYFEEAFDEFNTEKDVFLPAIDNVHSCVDGIGFNVFVFFYGANRDLIRNNRGFIYLTARALFTSISLEYDWKFSVKVSNWAMYNDDIVDLLTDGEDRKPHAVVTDLDGEGIHVSNLTQVEISADEEMPKVVKLAEENREKFLANCKDNPSMCSLFQFHVRGYNRFTKDEKQCSVFVVELVENKCGYNEHVTDWEDFIVQLSTQNFKSKNSYRKLMKYIKESYEKRSKTLVYATVCPEEKHLQDSLNILKFVSRLSTTQ